MAKKMLIDTAHPEEIRLAVIEGQRIENFESETQTPSRNNIYLAKITRVEPSLQAVFVEYGGNRHGFLAFNEIHPDYFQIPLADREAILKRDREAAEDESAPTRPDLQNGTAEEASEKPLSDNPESEGDGSPRDESPREESPREESPRDESPGGETQRDESPGGEARASDHDKRLDDSRRISRELRHAYKIQEVIKPRQILLVQVVKTERGNKGAALTTYISLAGRYCVLMPNTVAAGGISRKVSTNEREQLRSLSDAMEVPDGMSLIIRTAGARRSQEEIRHDFDYLLRHWEKIRSLTLKSTAPALIYEEGNLIHRSLRDFYDSHIDEVWIEGEEGFEEARDLMKILMPSHADKIKLHEGPRPLFEKHKIENQVSEILSPKVLLKSGGYLVINQTEALVAIDVNSGRFTSEHDLEDTAAKTNQEACEEIARQCIMRDLAGLIIVDFIDMEASRHVRDVERRLRDYMRRDRARVQVGRISAFGLLEMSRQRLRPGMTEALTEPCPHCEGNGRVISASQASLTAIRAIEAEAARTEKGKKIIAHLDEKSALYILNKKMLWRAEAEQRHGVLIEIAINPSAMGDGKSITFKTLEKMDSDPLPSSAVRISNAYLERESWDEEDGKYYVESQAKDSPLSQERADGKMKPRGRRGGRNQRGGRYKKRRPRHDSSSGESRASFSRRGEEGSSTRHGGDQKKSWWKGLLSKS